MARPRKPILQIRNLSDANRVMEDAGLPERVWYDRSSRAYYFCEGSSLDWHDGTFIDVILRMTPQGLLDTHRDLSTRPRR